MKPWEANIRKTVPYVPGEQPDKPRMIKLNEAQRQLALLESLRAAGMVRPGRGRKPVYV